MKRNNMRRLLIGAFATICITPLIAATVVSCTNVDNVTSSGGNNVSPVVPPSTNNPSKPNIDNNPTNPSPDHKPPVVPPETGGDTDQVVPPAPPPAPPTPPQPSKPVLESVSISLSPNGSVEEGKNITATATIRGSNIENISYSWRIIDGVTSIPGNSSTVSFVANNGDNGKTLEVTATSGNQRKIGTIQLSITPKPIAPVPPPPPPEPPVPQPQPPQPPQPTGKRKLADCEFEVVGTDFIYNGQEQRPEVLASYNGDNLAAGYSFQAVYSSNTAAGTAHIHLTGIGNYEGTKDLTFEIQKAPNKITKFTLDKDNIPHADVDYGTPSFKYYSDETCTKLYDSGRPTSGTYYVKAFSEPGDNYLAQESDESFMINFDAPAPQWNMANAKINYKSFLNVYTGQPIKPNFELRDVTDGSEITSDTFDTKYGENINVGKGWITVTATAIYKGSKTFYFDIVKKQNGINHFQIKNGQPYAECLQGNPTFKYFKDQACTQSVTGVPNAAGKYYVIATSTGDRNHASNKTYPLPYYVRSTTGNPPSRNIDYVISAAKTSGLDLHYYNDKVRIIVTNKQGKEVYNKDFTDQSPDQFGNLYISLPAGDYTAQVVTKDPITNQYKYHTTINMSWRDGIAPYSTLAEKPVYNISFDPQMKNDTYTPPSTYKVADVVGDIHLTDVYGNKFSLADNAISSQKVTVFIFFRSNCPHSIASIENLQRIMIQRNWIDKVNVFLISNYPADVNSDTKLKTFLSDKTSNMFAVKDPDDRIRSQFYDPTGYPKIAIMDYQGVVLKRMTGRQEGLHDFDSIQYGIKNYNSSNEVGGE